MAREQVGEECGFQASQKWLLATLGSMALD